MIGPPPIHRVQGEDARLATDSGEALESQDAHLAEDEVDDLGRDIVEDNRLGLVFWFELEVLGEGVYDLSQGDR